MEVWCDCGACLTLEEIDTGQCGCCGRRFRRITPPPYRSRKQNQRARKDKTLRQHLTR